MKLKQLEGLLGSIQQFPNPKLELEQYPTGPHIASRLVYTAENTFGDVNGKVVADFGCGCGTLGIAGALMDADYIMGFDIDSQSLETASQNVELIEICKGKAEWGWGGLKQGGLDLDLGWFARICARTDVGSVLEVVPRDWEGGGQRS
ncbi:hypothetical protein KSP40_PGU014462 [Platanthera guangdongensis]|uniref:Ribosomal protein L11 methyltransferase n=1 Tax=Platanthera guangdongensis TaxID=2320717 RepID=A0ABR2N0B8_9ASPA